MKTLVTPAHLVGPAENGTDQCYARVGYNGLCPGASTAEWLNGLGEDHEQYIQWPSGVKRETNGDVRDNWLKANVHIVARDPQMAVLMAERRRLHAQLRRNAKMIAQVQP